MSKHRELTIRTAQTTAEATLYPFHTHMSKESYMAWLSLCRNVTGDPFWHPGNILEIEGKEEIRRIMQSNSDWKGAR